MTKEELNEIFKEVAKDMQSDGTAERIGIKAKTEALKSNTPIEVLASAQITASIEYSNELLFRVLAKVMCKS